MSCEFKYTPMHTYAGFAVSFSQKLFTYPSSHIIAGTLPCERAPHHSLAFPSHHIISTFAFPQRHFYTAALLLYYALSRKIAFDAFSPFHFQ